MSSDSETPVPEEKSTSAAAKPAAAKPAAAKPAAAKPAAAKPAAAKPAAAKPAAAKPAAAKPAAAKKPEKPVEIPAFEKGISDKLIEKFGDKVEVAFIKKIELESMLVKKMYMMLLNLFVTD